ncbi:MAG: MgtC/SapB family protein [Clostridiaceae bacterium]|nr:MgtC/SapB family protein [Eubacteriales bacterium]
MDGWSFFFENIYSIAARLLFAAAAGGALGFERTRKLRGAGLRTYMLVCLGSAMAMMTGEYISHITGTSDPARIAAQVVSGIGFIGAGTIMVTGYHRVKGITTAAGLWLCACLGLAIGIGFYGGALLMLSITLVTMLVGEKLQKSYLARGNRMRVYALLSDADSLGDFLRFLKQHGIALSDFEQLNAIGKSVSATFVLKLNAKHAHAETLDLLAAGPGVAFLEEV